MHSQQNICPHLVALLFFISSQHILQRIFSLLSFLVVVDSVPYAVFIILREYLWKSFYDCFQLYIVQICLRDLMIRVTRMRYPYILQLTSFSPQFLKVQTQLIPRSDQIIVYLLFQFSINSMSISHYKLDIISSPVPIYLTTFLLRPYNSTSSSCFLFP